MTDKQAVIDALDRLPEKVSLEEIAEELRIMVAIQRGRAGGIEGTRSSESAQHGACPRLALSWLPEPIDG